MPLCPSVRKNAALPCPAHALLQRGSQFVILGSTASCMPNDMAVRTCVALTKYSSRLV